MGFGDRRSWVCHFAGVAVRAGVAALGGGLDSGGRVQLVGVSWRAGKSVPRIYQSDISWYDPKLHYANFIVLDSQPGYFSHWEPLALIKEYFGTPARTYQTGPYTILVWNRNLLPSVPGNLAIQG